MKIQLFIFWIFSFGLFAQEIPKQVIRGTVTDALSGKTLVGASVLLPGTMPIKGTTTDEKGRYRLENVPVGRYTLETTYLGYELLSIPTILVESGKELVLDIALYEQAESLNEVVVKSNRRQGTSLSKVSVQSITVEEVLRYPATFNDPARLATSYSGVVNTNDQANHISVRGNSPNSTSWRLEGVEIVNPNHLGDAGTTTGRPSVSGGGVNILSAQLLGTSNFYSGAFPTEYGNAIGGIMDMRFRNGNDEKHEFTGQAGLVGFDFSAEGPLSKSKGISYLINYRYSFVGLLSAMGVDFGGESISFQDLAFNVKIPLDQHSVLKVFGMGGVSENIFKGKENPEERLVDKDRFNIDYTNRMGAIGANYAKILGDKASLKATFVTSALRTNKQSTAILEETILFDSILYRKTAVRGDFTYKLHKKHHLKIGTSLSDHLFNVDVKYSGLVLDDNEFNGREGGLLLENYLKWTWLPISAIDVTIGLHQSRFVSTDDNSFEPRTSISWQAGLKDRFSFAYGLHTQLQPAQTYIGNELGLLGFTKSHHFVFSYKRNIGTKSELSAEIYYQSLFDVPIIEADSRWDRTYYSTINLVDDFKEYRLIADGTGRNYGLEVNWQRFLSDDYFFLANTSFYRSKYTPIDGVERNSRFDGQYLMNLTGGKEFKWTKNEKRKILGLNARVTYAGGLRRTPIDTETSPVAGTTIEDRDALFSLKQKDYFKIDFRIYLKNNKENYNTTFALDLQNMTNRKNDGYHYYDQIQERVIAQKQLGLIPNLSYRVEF